MATAESQRQWRVAHREEHRAYQRRYRREHPEQERAWRAKNPRAAKAITLRSKYGINLEQYEEILATQGGCYFCGKPETANRPDAPVHFLAVDHDHATGKIRGLLCVGCNISLGYFERGQRSRLDPERVRAYLAIQWF